MGGLHHRLLGVGSCLYAGGFTRACYSYSRYPRFLFKGGIDELLTNSVNFASICYGVHRYAKLYSWVRQLLTSHKLATFVYEGFKTSIEKLSTPSYAPIFQVGLAWARGSISRFRFARPMARILFPRPFLFQGDG